MEGRFIKNAMDVKDIAGASPSKPKVRKKVYNAIDYTDVNIHKRSYITNKEESVFKGKPLPSVVKKFTSIRSDDRKSRKEPLMGEYLTRPKIKSEATKKTQGEKVNGINFKAKAFKRESLTNREGTRMDKCLTETVKEDLIEKKMAKNDEQIILHGGNKINQEIVNDETNKDINSSTEVNPTNNIKEEVDESKQNPKKTIRDKSNPSSKEMLTDIRDTEQTSNKTEELSNKKTFCNMLKKRTTINTNPQSKLLERLISPSNSNIKKARYGPNYESQSQFNSDRTKRPAVQSSDSLAANYKNITSKQKFTPYIGKTIVYKNLKKRCGGLVTFTYYSPK